MRWTTVLPYSSFMRPFFPGGGGFFYGLVECSQMWRYVMLSKQAHRSLFFHSLKGSSIPNATLLPRIYSWRSWRIIHEIEEFQFEFSQFASHGFLSLAVFSVINWFAHMKYLARPRATKSSLRFAFDRRDKEPSPTGRWEKSCEWRL